jgi:hypothetical protein
VVNAGVLSQLQCGLVGSAKASDGNAASYCKLLEQITTLLEVLPLPDNGDVYIVPAFSVLFGDFNSLTHPTPLGDLRELNRSDCCLRQINLF